MKNYETKKKKNKKMLFTRFCKEMDKTYLTNFIYIKIFL